MPRILLAEDDPVSRMFLLETLRDIGLAVAAVGDGNAALAAARSECFDLLILDHRLPGMDGDRVLMMLRAKENAASRLATALATTADPDPDVHALLRGAGFACVQVKPLDAASLGQTLRGLGIVAAADALDHAAGLSASGSAGALRALRELFVRELVELDDELECLSRDPLALDERLHRLRAACGFCGATTLADAATKLADAVRASDGEHMAKMLDAFRRCAAMTQSALRDVTDKSL